MSEELRAELGVAYKLLDARNALLREIPACPDHGDQCVPHAIEWVREEVRRRHLEHCTAYHRTGRCPHREEA